MVSDELIKKFSNMVRVRECAQREVEEETGLKIAIQEKISATWHTYIRAKKTCSQTYLLVSNDVSG